MIVRTPSPKPIPRDLPLVVWVTADDDATTSEEPALRRPRAYLLGGLALLATLLVTAVSLLNLGGWEAITATFTLP